MIGKDWPSWTRLPVGSGQAPGDALPSQHLLEAAFTGLVHGA